MTDQAAALIDELQTYMRDAREMCERAEFVALEGLDARVKRICDAIGQLPVSQARQYASQLDDLGDELKTLQEHFEAKRAELGDEISGTGKHHQAAKAYAKPEFSTPKES